MKTMTSNTPGIPAATSLLLTLRMLLTVTTLPTRFRVVILKREQPQPQGSEQAENPDKRGNDTEALFPDVHAHSVKNTDKKIKEHGTEVKQQAELQELEIRTKQFPDVDQRNTSVQTNMPRGWVADVPSSSTFDKAEIGFGLTAGRSRLLALMR
jgi:hypothetical protein